MLSLYRRHGEPWNHNIHYHPEVLGAVPPGARRALDVGCGEGALARQLRRAVPLVVGLDRDGPTLERAHARGGGVAYVLGDALAHPFEPGSFDLVAAVCSAHHVGTATALAAMRDLVRPGGALALIGVGRPRYPADLPHEVAAAVGTRVHKLTKAYHDVDAPMVWPPPETFRDVRRLVARALPGARYRRRLLWRYTVTWTRPE